MKKGPFNPNALLWWIAIISLAVSGSIYYFLGRSGELEFNQGLDQKRMFVVVVGVIIAGVCVIAGTAGRWFYPK